ncbi:MAG TPA: RluA family pseudouridine synthase [Nitrobacter sp.]|nr:RluA family pseudouridine synthase [Nitrobacter sp.]
MEPSDPRAVAVVVPAEAAGDRLDRTLARLLPDLSRTRIQALARAGKVARADGTRLEDPSAAVAAGERIVIVLPEPEPAAPVAQALPLQVVYDDADLIVIDKPAGLVVHPAAGHTDGTLVNALLAYCGSSLSGIGGVARPGIVHRLDKDTSGLLVVAKTDFAHQALARQFADHGRSGPLERAYAALAWGVPAPPAFTIDRPIIRDPAHRERMAVTLPGRGREAVTHGRVEERFGDSVASLVECRLETGRTHQIRLHLAHVGHPLMGDPVYGSGFRSKAAKLGPTAREALAALGRQALHARRLGFAHPRDGRRLAFDSPLPADMERLVEALRAEPRADTKR